MHIKFIIANIKIVLGIIFISAIILIFPIFLNIEIFFNSEFKKLFFAIKLFGIKCIGGYVEKVFDGFTIHITKNFAVIIPFKNLLSMRTKVKPLRDYHFIKFNTSVDLGTNKNLLLGFSFGFILNYIYNISHWLAFNIKPYLNCKNNINIFEDKQLFNFSIDSTILLNLLMIILSIIKIIMEKIFYAFRHKKQQN